MNSETMLTIDVSNAEKDGDLRKDSRIMEFNSVVNRLLKESPEGRRRNLLLRTFSVVCLNEECGILEWVNHTECLRQLITLSQPYWSDLFSTLNYKVVDMNVQYIRFLVIKIYHIFAGHISTICTASD